MPCVPSASKPSASPSVLLLVCLPFVWVLMGLQKLKRLLKPVTPTQTASQRPRNAILVSNYLIAVRTPLLRQETASHDDFDPEVDDWARWLDDEHVVEASRHHLDRCFRHDTPPNDNP